VDLGSDAREEVEHRLPELVGDRNIRVSQDLRAVLARVQGDDLGRLWSGLVEDLKEIAGLTSTSPAMNSFGIRRPRVCSETGTPP